MAYNMFPTTYPQAYPQYYAPSTQPNNPFIWIQGGVAGANAYQVAPNSTAVLWDSEEQVIYIKSADMQGKPSIRVLDYTIRTEAPKTALNAISGNTAQIPTRDDITALQGQIDALKGQIERITNESTVQPVSKPESGGITPAEVSAVSANISRKPTTADSANVKYRQS